MKHFLIFLALIFSSWGSVLAANNDINIRDTTDITIGWNAEHDNLSTFIAPILDFFYLPTSNSDAVQNTFISIAWGIKNFFILIAVLFLVLGVLKLLFWGGDEEAQKKWKNNIVWVSVWVFFMQIAYSIWRTLYLDDTFGRVDGRLGWMTWANVFEPIVNILLLLASFAFIAMAIYAFYTIITGAWDEEKLKKWKNIIIYALIGYLLIRIPKILVTALYGEPSAACQNQVLSFGTCEIENQNLGESINIFGKILTYFNSFLALFAVVMVIYAGWLIFISGGDEEKLKKAKRTIIYLALGIILLVASQAIFRFFFLKG